MCDTLDELIFCYGIPIGAALIFLMMWTLGLL